MSSVDLYIEYVYLKYIGNPEFDNLFSGKWTPVDQFQESFVTAMDLAFREFGYIVPKKYKSIARAHLEQMINAGSVLTEGDVFTGVYNQIPVKVKDQYVNEKLNKNEVTHRIRNLGRGALVKALDNIASHGRWSRIDDNRESAPEDIAVVSSSAPASDRIVSFSDNQIRETDEQLSEVIRVVGEQNQISEDPGLREIILGQLKAGRELIRAGSFRLYIIEITLIQTLEFLVKRYEREAIGGLAAALIAALAKHIGIDV